MFPSINRILITLLAANIFTVSVLAAPSFITDPESALQAREEYSSDLDSREPEPMHIPIFSNWLAGKRQRDQDRKNGKKQRLDAEMEGGVKPVRRDILFVNNVRRQRRD